MAQAQSTLLSNFFKWIYNYLRMSDKQINSEIFDYFASDPLGVTLNVPIVANNRDHPVFALLEDQIKVFDKSVIEDTKNEELIQFHCSALTANDLDRQARIYHLINVLNKEIPKTRLDLLVGGMEIIRPTPYNHHALDHLNLNDNKLVPLKNFQVTGNKCSINDMSFTVVPPVQSLNSQHWFLNSIMKEKNVQHAYVRLDPLIMRPINEFAVMGYKAFWYGRPLNWAMIDSLKKDEHGRWAPTSIFTSSKSKFTDFVWSPRGNEIHFICEELPKMDEISERGSRYFHGIYNPRTKRFKHIDGSMRIYSEREWEERVKTHVRRTGKVGKRIKIFQIDGELSREAFSNICLNYFVWNDDVARYFGMDIPK